MFFGHTKLWKGVIQWIKMGQSHFIAGLTWYIWWFQERNPMPVSWRGVIKLSHKWPTSSTTCACTTKMEQNHMTQVRSRINVMSASRSFTPKGEWTVTSKRYRFLTLYNIKTFSQLMKNKCWQNCFLIAFYLCIHAYLKTPTCFKFFTALNVWL